MWVYGVAAGAFVLLIFIVSMIYLAWWVDQFTFPLICHRPHSWNPPHSPLWGTAPSPPSSTPTLTSQFLFFLFFFLPPSCRPLVRAAATVPRCIALLRPKSLTPTGRRSGWAKMHMRWFTPVPIAKSWLTPAAAANEDVEGSSPTPPNAPSSLSSCSPWSVPWPLSKVSHVLPD